MIQNDRMLTVALRLRNRQQSSVEIYREYLRLKQLATVSANP